MLLVTHLGLGISYLMNYNSKEHTDARCWLNKYMHVSMHDGIIDKAKAPTGGAIYVISVLVGKHRSLSVPVGKHRSISVLVGKHRSLNNDVI